MQCSFYNLIIPNIKYRTRTHNNSITVAVPHCLHLHKNFVSHWTLSYCHNLFFSSCKTWPLERKTHTKVQLKSLGLFLKRKKYTKIGFCLSVEKLLKWYGRFSKIFSCFLVNIIILSGTIVIVFGFRICAISLYFHS